MEFPQVFAYGADDEDGAAQDFARQVKALGIETPFVVCSAHGQRLAAGIGTSLIETPPSGATQQWAADLGSRAKRSGADAIIAIGGGRCLDVGKLAATRAGLITIAAPTQLSHDGICSPVAVVPEESGTTESVGAIAPRAVYLSVPTLREAPIESVRAGIGDLIANPYALRDWALAARHGLAETDERAWGLSVESFELIRPFLTKDPAHIPADPDSLRRLADALILSGTAMIVAGTSRPASGGEHEISHAIDELFRGRALHGAQVAFGCIVSAALYGDDVTALKDQLAGLDLPTRPQHLGLSTDDTVRLLLAAPETRPGRFTILEEADLDAARARTLLQQIWSDA